MYVSGPTYLIRPDKSRIAGGRSVSLGAAEGDAVDGLEMAGEGTPGEDAEEVLIGASGPCAWTVNVHSQTSKAVMQMHRIQGLKAKGALRRRALQDFFVTTNDFEGVDIEEGRAKDVATDAG